MNDEKKNGFERLNFSYKKSSNEFGLDFGNRKDSNIRELDLNISNSKFNLIGDNCVRYKSSDC